MSEHGNDETKDVFASALNAQKQLRKLLNDLNSENGTKMVLEKLHNIPACSCGSIQLEYVGLSHIPMSSSPTLPEFSFLAGFVPTATIRCGGCGRCSQYCLEKLGLLEPKDK